MNKAEKLKLIEEVLQLVKKAVTTGEDIRVWNYIKNKGKGFTGFSFRTGVLQTDGTWSEIKKDKFIGTQE